MSPTLEARTRVAAPPPADGFRTTTRAIEWRPPHTAVIICDMWDTTDCVSALRRVMEMAPALNDVAGKLRRRGALIIHAPSSCAGYYQGTPARRRALDAPHADAPVAFAWNAWDPEREAPLPMIVDDSEPCSCDTKVPCRTGGPTRRLTRQIASIGITDDDAVTDDGQEVFNLCVHRDIDLVILTGVHTNRCVLGRPFGIRQLVYLGMSTILCRDLTDSYHREPGGQLCGTDRVVEHIERYWCPTVTSDQLVGGRPFRFRDDG